MGLKIGIVSKHSEWKHSRVRPSSHRTSAPQGLFRNYGDAFLPLLWPHLEQLAADPHESSQRCVCEITAGLLRGSKLWSFSKVAQSRRRQDIAADEMKSQF